MPLYRLPRLLRQISASWSVPLLSLCAVAVVLSSMAGAAARHRHVRSIATPVELKPQPGTELEKQARILNADLLEDARRHHDRPIILTGTAHLATRQKNADTILLVQLQSYRLCGSAGCTTSIYRHSATGWETLLDSVNGSISITRQHHKGMADLLIDGHDRWIFDGQHYQDIATTP